jgi:hypothetical protein
MGGGDELWKPDVAARPDERPVWRTDCIVGLCLIIQGGCRRKINRIGE